jgi:hypothetical protein
VSGRAKNRETMAMKRTNLGTAAVALLMALALGASNASAESAGGIGLYGAKVINTPDTLTAPAFDGDRAFWAGACDLFAAPAPGDPIAGGIGARPLIEPAPSSLFGFDETFPSPPLPRDCIDIGAYAQGGTGHPSPDPSYPDWEIPPSWRLPAVTQAGSHPEGTASFTAEQNFSTTNGVSVDNARNVNVDLPPGVVGNPVAIPKCSLEDFAASPVQCPPQSQVGVTTIRLVSGLVGQRGENWGHPVYNLEPREGYVAEFGLADVAGSGIIGTSVRVWARARTESDLGVTSGVFQIPTAYPFLGQHFTFWGVPWASSHDRWRIAQGGTLGNPNCGDATHSELSGTGLIPSCRVSYDPSWGPIKPFFSLQTSCTGEAVNTALRMDSYQNPGGWVDSSERLPFRVPDPNDPNWMLYQSASPPATGCGDLGWDPSLTMEPAERRADTPTAFDVLVSTPQNNDAPSSVSHDPDDATGAPAFFKSKAGLATSHLKDTVVKLAEGIGFNAAAAHGLDGCSTEEIGLTSPIGVKPITFDNKDATCPENALIGTIEVKTPLLDESLPGFVYLADQDDNPFGSTFAIYLVLQNRDRNLIVKIAGSVEPDPKTGQITSEFLKNPQLPFGTFAVHFRGGPNAPLVTPTTCGTHSNESDLTGWSQPNSPGHFSDPFEISSAPSGCPTSKAARPFELDLSAGSTNTQAGAKSPFQIQITRADGNQELDRLEISPPPGFVASLKGIPYCSEAAIAVASNRSGKAEQANPSCPASQVGNALVGAGAGSSPYYAPGKLYLSGPYKGETLSVVSITPAVAGPYDLGTVVVRSALKLDPRTARITAVTDPLPQVFEGIPLRIRDVRINLDRPDWAINPTNCEPMSVDVKAFGASGAVTTDSSRYQLSGCEKLAFKPKLRIVLKGGTKRGDHPALLATLKARPGDANVARAAVTLPPSAFLDQAHIRTICTRVQFAAKACPKGAIYGSAIATTPLLNDPIKGDVFLRSSDNKLPDLVGNLRGVANIELVGRIDSVKGGIRNTFDVVPDAPVDTFTLRMQGGNKGLVINSKNLCAKTNRATVKLTAQNGRKYNFNPPVIAENCKKAKKNKKRGKRAAR